LNPRSISGWNELDVDPFRVPLSRIAFCKSEEGELRAASQSWIEEQIKEEEEREGERERES